MSFQDEMKRMFLRVAAWEVEPKEWETWWAGEVEPKEWETWWNVSTERNRKDSLQ